MKNTLSLITLLLTTLVHAQNAGSLDTSFGDAGKVFTIIGGIESKANGVAIQQDGKIVVVGYAVSSLGDKDFLAIRLNYDGSFDTSFGVNGIVLTDLQNYSDDIANSIAIQTDGKIVLAGESHNGVEKKAALIRLDTEGNIDSSFNSTGIVLSDWIVGQQDVINVIKFHLPTGNLIVGGYSETSSTVAAPILARYTSTGSLDNTFNTSGILNMGIMSGDDTRTLVVEDIAVKANGIISAAGWRRTTSTSITSDWWAGRVLSNGSLDTSFSTDGVLNYDETGTNFATSIELLANDNILLGGYRQYNGVYSFRFLNINSNGNIPAISSGFILTGSQDASYDMAIDINGKYVMAGRSGTSSISSFALTRIETIGAYDSSFGSSGITNTSFVSSAVNQCNEIAIQDDQKIIAVGFGGQGVAISRYLGIAQAELNNFTLIAPANASTNQSFVTLNLDWSDAQGATGYIVEWATENTFSTPQAANTILSQTSVSNLIPNTTYYWRAKAITETEQGNFIGPWSFTTTGLNNFNLQLPANNATNIAVASVTFNWTDVAGATGYEMQLDTDNAFSSPQISTPTASTTAVTALNTNTTYYWRVRATQGTVWGDWSSIWSFTTAQPQSVGEIQVINFEVYPSPANDYINISADTAVSDDLLIIDNLGRIVMTEKINGTFKKLEVSPLANGFYSVQFKNHHKSQLIYIQH